MPIDPPLTVATQKTIAALADAPLPLQGASMLALDITVVGPTRKTTLANLATFLTGGPGYLPLAGGVLIGNLAIDEPAGTAISLIGQRSSSIRWTIQLGNAAAETGANVGSDLSINRFDDTGALVDTALLVNRATGIVTVTDGLAVGTAGPTITSGIGVPSSTQPKGSLYMRTGGAVGSTLYVSQGAGTWNAVAGV
jgi:hypothetical protein